MLARRHWIPPLGLLFAQLCAGASWLLALWIAVRAGVGAVTLPEIAWIHLVALGWFTVAALSILFHALPNFIEVEGWRYESVGRGALVVVAASIAALVAAFLAAPGALAAVAGLLAGALIVYLTTAALTLVPAFRSRDRVARAVARAFAGLFAVVALVVALGVLLAWMISGTGAPAWIARLPGAHASLALFGWLTLLVYGVSARTLVPLTGARSRRPWMHVVYGTATLAGAPLLAAGIALPNAIASWSGGALIVAGVVCYLADVTDRLSIATVRHRIPQAFVAAALVWLLLATFVGAGVLAGAPWQAAFGFLMLAGWVGQMVNAHMLHIGVRLISTIARGDDDETRPQELLDARLTWPAFALSQLAVLVLAAGLLAFSATACAIGAAIGFFAWLTMVFALAGARRRAQRPIA